VDWLLANESNPALEVAALLATTIAVLIGSVARNHAANAVTPVVAFFWRDVAATAWVWAAATGVTLGAALGGVPGLSAPVVLISELALGLVLIGLLRFRWAREDLRFLAGRDVIPQRERPPLVSTTWEVGLLSGIAGAAIVLAVTLAVGWPYPAHWLMAVLGVALGYAAGIAAATPRYAVRYRGQ
jgi:hypothetical protein